MFHPGEPTHVGVPDAPVKPGTYSLRDVWKVTERRDGMVYKTEHVGEQWQMMSSSAYQVGDLIYASLPTSRTEQLIIENFFTIITVRQ